MKSSLNPVQEVVGFQQQKHLTGDAGEELADLRKVHGGITADLLSLKRARL